MRYEKWLKKNVTGLSGKQVLVTGANSGIGFAAAKTFSYLGANVILVCRNAQRAERAAETIRNMYPNVIVETELVDLASFASIDAFARRLQEGARRIDICLHCAGVYYPRDAYTYDGYPMTEGVNYIGTTRLAEAILPFMGETGRMIFTSSLVDRFGRPDVLPQDEGYDAYSRSKTLLSADVVRRAAARGKGEPAYMVTHPGITATDLLSPAKTTHKPFFSRLGHAFLYIFTHSPEKAALTSVYAAAGNVENGMVIGPRGLFGISGYPRVTRFAPRVRDTVHGKIEIIMAERRPENMGAPCE